MRAVAQAEPSVTLRSLRTELRMLGPYDIHLESLPKSILIGSVISFTQNILMEHLSVPGFVLDSVDTAVNKMDRKIPDLREFTSGVKLSYPGDLTILDFLKSDTFLCFLIYFFLWFLDQLSPLLYLQRSAAKFNNFY